MNIKRHTEGLKEIYISRLMNNVKYRYINLSISKSWYDCTTSTISWHSDNNIIISAKSSFRRWATAEKNLSAMMQYSPASVFSGWVHQSSTQLDTIIAKKVKYLKSNIIQVFLIISFDNAMPIFCSWDSSGLLKVKKFSWIIESINL